MATKEVIWDEFGWLVMAEKEQIRRNMEGRLAGVLVCSDFGFHAVI